MVCKTAIKQFGLETLWKDSPDVIPYASVILPPLTKLRRPGPQRNIGGKHWHVSDCQRDSIGPPFALELVRNAALSRRTPSRSFVYYPTGEHVGEFPGAKFKHSSVYTIDVLVRCPVTGFHCGYWVNMPGHSKIQRYSGSVQILRFVAVRAKRFGKKHTQTERTHWNVFLFLSGKKVHHKMVEKRSRVHAHFHALSVWGHGKGWETYMRTRTKPRLRILPVNNKIQALR